MITAKNLEKFKSQINRLKNEVKKHEESERLKAYFEGLKDGYTLSLKILETYED